jgi:hypothetical protein
MVGMQWVIPTTYSILKGKKMQKIAKWLRDEVIYKLVASVFMFLGGISTLFIAIHFCNNSKIGMGVVLLILGLVFSVLGIIPLISKWCNWQDIE